MPPVTRIFTNRLAAFVAIAAIGFTTACGEIRTVALQPLPFENASGPIPGDVEVCIQKKLRARRWNAGETGYRIELGSRATLNFERLAKASFRDAVVVFDEQCGERTDHPWITASIVSAKRDWDGLQGWITPTPVDTELTLSIELHQNDGAEIWSTRATGTHSTRSTAMEHGYDVVTHSVFFPLLAFRSSELARRARRDFGIVLASAFEQVHDRMMKSPSVRAAFEPDVQTEVSDAADPRTGTDG